ncbi:MAG: hypothetical protein ACOYME_11855, partial [Prochlorotrichaceae cyanobacterium]
MAIVFHLITSEKRSFPTIEIHHNDRFLHSKNDRSYALIKNDRFRVKAVHLHLVKSDNTNRGE